MSGMRINSPIETRQSAAFLQQCECYPGPDHFAIDFDRSTYENRLRQHKSGETARPFGLSIYGASALTGEREAKSKSYAELLQQELELIVAFLPPDLILNRLYCQIHASGCDQLMQIIQRHFHLRSQDQHTIAAGLEHLSEQRLVSLVAIGFNCLNIEIHDATCTCSCDASTLKTTVRAARQAGFKAITITSEWPRKSSAIYQELIQLIAAEADQIILHPLPQPFLQSKFPDLWNSIGDLFKAYEYVYLGMYNFVAHDNDLLIARTRGRLNYDVHGYFSGTDGDSFGLGLGAITRLGDFYVQNESDIHRYRAMIDNRRLPLRHGIQLNADDLLRRDVMRALICHLELSFEAINVAHLINFKQYFAPELKCLEILARDGLVELNEEWISVKSRGMFYLPEICHIFNTYRHSSKD